MKSNENGFTLIELMLVLAVLGLLSGLAISIIDPVKSQGRARDGVRMNNVKNLSEGIESYRQAEGIYPSNGDPTDVTSLLRTVYLKSWPVGYDDAGNVDETNYGYKYSLAGQGFILYVRNSTGGCFKYQTDWRKAMECPISQCNSTVSASSNCN